MRCQMCKTSNKVCPAWYDDCEKCGLGFPVEVKKSRSVFGVNMRYYGPIGKCTKPKSIKEFIETKLSKPQH